MPVQENTIEQIATYLVERQYNGWFPNLIYWGAAGNGVPWSIRQVGSGKISLSPDHDCVFPDYTVTDDQWTTRGRQLPAGAATVDGSLFGAAAIRVTEATTASSDRPSRAKVPGDFHADPDH